jgi:hypothetical protein
MSDNEITNAPAKDDDSTQRDSKLINDIITYQTRNSVYLSSIGLGYNKQNEIVLVYNFKYLVFRRKAFEDAISGVLDDHIVRFVMHCFYLSTKTNFRNIAAVRVEMNDEEVACVLWATGSRWDEEDIVWASETMGMKTSMGLCVS